MYCVLRNFGTRETPINDAPEFLTSKSYSRLYVLLVFLLSIRKVTRSRWQRRVDNDTAELFTRAQGNIVNFAMKRRIGRIKG